MDRVVVVVTIDQDVLDVCIETAFPASDYQQHSPRIQAISRKNEVDYITKTKIH